MGRTLLIASILSGWLFCATAGGQDTNSIFGLWKSDWGPITLAGNNQNVTGSWQQSSGTGQIRSGTYDPATRKLSFTYFQPWNNVNGTSTLTLNPAGDTLSGTWINAGGGTGSWTINLTERRPPDNANSTPPPSGGGGGPAPYDLAGAWRRTDGLELEYRKSGDQYTGYIKKLDAGAAAAFKVGEAITSAKRAADGTYAGTGTFRSTSGSESHPAFKATFKDANNFTTDLGESYTRVTPIPDAGGGLEIEGSWSRTSDGHVVRFEKAGDGYIGTIVDPGGLSGLFRAGERTFELKRTAPGTYEGKILYRFTDGRSEWRAEKIVLSNADHFSDGAQWIRSGAGQCEKTFAKTWNSNWGQFAVRVEGTRATGTYANREGRNGAGTFTGTLSGNVMNASWSDSVGSGTFSVTLADSGCRFDGTYTINSGPGAGTGPQPMGGTDVRMGNSGNAASGGGNTGNGSGTTASSPGSAGTAEGVQLVAPVLWVAAGTQVLVPINLVRAADVRNMDFELSYRPDVVKALPDAERGSLLSELSRYKLVAPGTFRFNFAQLAPINGNGSVAGLHFQATGAAGSSTPLTLKIFDAGDSNRRRLSIATVGGSITIYDPKSPPGATSGGGGSGTQGAVQPTCSGTGKQTVNDAICCLEIWVGLKGPKQAYMQMDVNGDGDVNSSDAIIILDNLAREANR